jgi:hypothetical protein
MGAPSAAGLDSSTEALFEMIGGGFVNVAPLINYAAWRWSEEVDKAWLASRIKMPNVKPWPLPSDLSRPDVGDEPGKVNRLAATAEGRYVLARSLTHMRTEITKRTHARVVLGGKPHTFFGIMPGIVEEALLTIRQDKPLYVLGGTRPTWAASERSDTRFPTARVVRLCQPTECL